VIGNLGDSRPFAKLSAVSRLPATFCLAISPKINFRRHKIANFDIDVAANVNR